MAFDTDKLLKGGLVPFEGIDPDEPTIELKEGLTDHEVEEKYRGYLENAELHRGEPVLLVSRDVTNFLKSGPGDRHRHMGIKTDIRVGIVTEDFKAAPSEPGRILTGPKHVSESSVGLFEHDRPLDITIYNARDSFKSINDRFSRIDNKPKPCFEAVFGAENIANWFNGDDEDLKILYSEEEYIKRISEARHGDHLAYLKIAEVLGFEPVMTEAIKLSFERRRNAIVLRLSQIAVMASKAKIEKVLKKQDDASLPKTAEALRRESQEIGISHGNLVGYISNELSKGMHVALDE